MNIQVTSQSGELTVTISGRVDSSVAPQLQSTIQDTLQQHADDITAIVIEVSELTYISSMGLRVLLQLRQRCPVVRVTGCSDDVFNVFKMTGFNHILTVEKALSTLSLEGLIPLDGMEHCYQINDETMLQIFPSSTQKTDVDHLVKVTKECFQMGVPTPMTFDIVTTSEGLGLVYEAVQPTGIVSAKTLSTMLRQFHEHIIEPDGVIPSATERMKLKIRQLSDYLGDDAVAKLLQLLSAIPEASSLLHGNLCLENIKERDGENVFINLGDVCYGNVVIDLAHLYATISNPSNSSNPSDYFEELMHSYYDVESEDTIQRNIRNVRILSVIDSCLHFFDGGEPAAERIEAARTFFQQQVASRWDELMSHLHFKMDFNEAIRKLERQRFYTDSEVNIDWIADRLGTNRHYVSDYFNKVLHTTFSDYLSTMRLNYAAELLRSRKVSQQQIAYAAGFNNDHTFRRLFKQRFGCTPSQFEG